MHNQFELVYNLMKLRKENKVVFFKIFIYKLYNEIFEFFILPSLPMDGSSNHNQLG